MTQRANTSAASSKVYPSTQPSRVDLEQMGYPALGNASPFLIPPPPPPPNLTRMAPYIIGAPKQRTAQQKIYEYKHRKSFGYY